MQVKISVKNRLHNYKRLLGNGELFLFVTTAGTKTGVSLIFRKPFIPKFMTTRFASWLIP